MSSVSRSFKSLCCCCYRKQANRTEIKDDEDTFLLTPKENIKKIGALFSERATEVNTKLVSDLYDKLLISFNENTIIPYKGKELLNLIFEYLFFVHKEGLIEVSNINLPGQLSRNISLLTKTETNNSENKFDLKINLKKKLKEKDFVIALWEVLFNKINISGESIEEKNSELLKKLLFKFLLSTSKNGTSHYVEYSKKSLINGDNLTESKSEPKELYFFDLESFIPKKDFLDFLLKEATEDGGFLYNQPSRCFFILPEGADTNQMYMKIENITFTLNINPNSKTTTNLMVELKKPENGDRPPFKITFHLLKKHLKPLEYLLKFISDLNLPCPEFINESIKDHDSTTHFYNAINLWEKLIMNLMTYKKIENQDIENVIKGLNKYFLIGTVI